ncbi:MAG TPA: hypothetical protein VF264_02050 [Rhodanobacteraceae bacterium]
MSEAPHHPDEHAATRRGIRWDALAAIIASLVGLLALIVAGYTAYMQRQQIRAQVWPYVEMGSSNADGHYELVAINKGVGPAIIKSVQVRADGKPVDSWGAMGKLFGFAPSVSPVESTLNQMVLSPGEELHWIKFSSAADIDKFKADWSRFHVEARVCYTSTLGESWLAVYRINGGQVPKPVSHCPDANGPNQFND